MQRQLCSQGRCPAASGIGFLELGVRATFSDAGALEPLHQTLEPHVSTQRIIGIVLLILGIVLLVVGVNSSNSVVDQVSETFTGRFTDKTTWYLIGGVISALVGVLMLSVPWGRKS